MKQLKRYTELEPQQKKILSLPFRLFARIVKQTPGVALGRRAICSIRRNSLKSFIQSSVMYRLRRYASAIRLIGICGKDIYHPFDSNWPDKGRFLPVQSISSSGREGKPSLCFVTANMSAGGTERQVATLACELKKIGYKVRVRVLRLEGENGHYLPYLRTHGVDISVPRMPTVADIKFMRKKGIDISLIKHLPAELRIDAMALTIDFLRRPVDIVHCYLDWCCCYGGFAALLSGIHRVRFSWRNVNPTRFAFFREWMPRLYNFFLQFARITFENNSFAGASDYTQWLGLPSTKVEVIPNGLDPAWLTSSGEKNASTLRETIGIAPTTPLVLSIGRLVAQKRPFDLPKILVALRKNLPLATLVHIGTGPLKNDLQKRIDLDGLTGKKGADKAMVLLGRRENVFSILNSSDVFLLPSAYEGMPNAIMEAMAAGLPVVATRIGGVTDLIEDGVHGFLHNVGDINAMAKSLERLLNDPVLRQQMGNAGRVRILSKFTIQHLADRIRQSYVAQCSSLKQEC